VTRQRVWVDRGVTLVASLPEGVELEGALRLRPGREIDLVLSADPPETRQAVVWTWCLVRVGSEGPVFRGVCRWT
jgi:hypothetical protein